MENNYSYDIICDAGCDLGAALCSEYGIKIVQGHINLPDGREIITSQEWRDFSREEFYTALKQNPKGYATSPASVGEFTLAFDASLQKGRDIIAISISGGISGTVNFMNQAAKELSGRYPGRRIVIIDSRRFGPGFGLMAITASKLRASGAGIDETAAWLEENKNRIHQMGWLDDLTFVARKGRITHSKAFFGTLAGVKPVGEFDYNGLTTVLGKVRGEAAAYEVQLEYISRTIEKPEEQTLFIAQTNRMRQAIEYKRMIEERFHPKEVIINDVFAFCGINIGPGLMAAYYFGKPISANLEAEKTIFSEITKKEKQ